MENEMKLLHSLALNIGLLVGVWVYISVGYPELNLSPWIGFVAWASFFAAGGASDGAKKSLAAGIVAILLTALTLYCVQLMGNGLMEMVVFIAILGFLLVAMGEVPILAFTPAAFLGAASFFGTGGNINISILYVLLSWVAGIGLGFISEDMAKRMAKVA
tara:strand:+ start:120404 stop:120883 length:480 start_codon:yes stop_codon:yes gene_type:complete